MVFNSIGFAVFFTVVFFLHWFIFNKNHKTQNMLLLAASVVFYCLADWKFIFLLTASGFINFYLAKIIAEKEEGRIRKLYFYSGIAFNVGILLYFKYFNFFIQSFVSLFNYIGSENISFTPFHILLPLGISFFTFQLIGYLIDVNNETIEPYNDFLSFFTYLAYFPKILSGPIERAQQFIPQIQKKREFSYSMAADGIRQFLWGLFKKVVIANNLTTIVDIIFIDFHNMSGSLLFLGGILYAISLYADFSGFTDMACGVSKLFNIKITNNFAFPFFSTNISDFWRKWHISLTTWMMDYVFTPLNFILRKYKKAGLILSIVSTFLLVGFWHGANWTFIVFGLMHGLYFIPIIIKGSVFQTGVVAKGKVLPTVKEFTGMAGLFLIVAATMVFFRSENISDAFSYFSIIFSESFFTFPDRKYFEVTALNPLIIFILIFLFFIIEWFGREGEYAVDNLVIKWSKPVRWGFYYFIIILLVVFGGSHQQFIYFQF
jgi:alginate O-acetyltransferase complex protein AlgI